jgi:hypothetical protein
LHKALIDLGADLVLEADPNEVSHSVLANSGANAVLVSVEPAVDAAVERLESALTAPGLRVLFDEAETTAQLSGWDLNRWARHLAGKLLGRGVLPPGAEAAEEEEAATHLQPGIPSSPASLAHDARIEDFAEEVSASAAEVPSGYVPAAQSEPVRETAPAAPASWAAAPEETGDPEALDLDFSALEQAMTPPPSSAPEAFAAPLVESRLPAEPPTAEAMEAFEFEESIDLRGLEMVETDELQESVELPALPATRSFENFESSSEMEVEELTLTEEELAAFGEMGSLSFSSEPDVPADVEDAAGDLEMDPELARLAASFDENLESVSLESAPSGLDEALSLAPREALPASAEPPPIPDFDFDFDLAENKPDAPAAPMVPVAPAPKPSFDLSALELAPMDDLPAAAPAPAAVAVAAVTVPEPAIDHLSLSPLTEGEEAKVSTGVVLVIAGIGGPDAVRQLLRALPLAFPRAVLLQQNLDGGRHDRFVEQLAKVSRLPVALSEPTETPPAGAVRVLPEGASSAGVLSFPRSEGVAALVAAVAETDGAFVVLSGADESVVEPIAAALSQGARVFVQDPASCFDAKAVLALAQAGAVPLASVDLASRLDACFPE